MLSFRILACGLTSLQSPLIPSPAFQLAKLATSCEANVVGLFANLLKFVIFQQVGWNSNETFTCIHLADAFILSDLQERALQKVHRSMIINKRDSPQNIAGSQNMKHTLRKTNKHH